MSWLSLVALALLATGAAVVSVSTSPKGPSAPAPAPGASLQASIAGFAGYGLNGPVEQIAADITVPSISSIPASSSFGTASTWVGAQNTEGVFVQLGITETEDRTAGSTAQQYDGFWSDTSRHFHPIRIASVKAGDEISVEMQLESAGWVLHFKDVSVGSSYTVRTDYGAGQKLDFSEWFQEDPVSSADPLRNLPYASMPEVTFSRLELDGRSPDLQDDDAEAMDVADGPLLVPTSFRSDGFGVIPAVGYARQYLSDVAGNNLALQMFAIAVYERRPDSGGPKVVSSAALLARALDAFEDAMAGQTWPGRAQKDVQALLAKSFILSVDLRDLEFYGPTVVIEERILTDETVDQRLAELVRADLGLPAPA